MVNVRPNPCLYILGDEGNIDLVQVLCIHVTSLHGTVGAQVKGLLDLHPSPDLRAHSRTELTCTPTLP